MSGASRGTLMTMEHDRHGGYPEARERALALLTPIRDGIIASAELNGGETLLDVGCGDALIALAAVDALPNGRVIFSIQAALTREEAGQLEAHLRDLLENGQSSGPGRGFPVPPRALACDA